MGPRMQMELYRVGSLDPPIMRNLDRDLGAYLSGEIRIASRVVDPAPAFDPRRRQYSATQVLEALLQPPPGGDERRIGIAAVDLFLPVFSHVLGAAQLDGCAGVVSVYRLRPEAPGLGHDAGGLRARIFKEVLHELGHTFGLVHCRLSWCAMAASTLPEHIDLKDPRYCPACASRVGVLR